MTRLSDYLNEQNKEFLSTREMAQRAKKHGINASHVSMSRYLRGEHPEPAKDSILKAFSIALKVPLEKLQDLGAAEQEGSPFLLPDKARTLDKEERAVILQMVDVLADRKTVAPSMEGFALAALKEPAQDIDEGDMDA